MDIDLIIVGLFILIAGITAYEIKFSAAILEIIAGVIAFNLLGVQGSEILDFLATLGLVGVMFYAGLETNIEAAKKGIKKNIFLAIPGYFVPLLIIFAFGKIVLQLSLLTSIVIAISLSTTSLALVYALIRENPSILTESKDVVIPSAMIIDLLSMLSLTLTFAEFTLEALIWFPLIVLLYFVVSRGLPKLAERYKGNLAELELRFILVLLVALPFISEQVLISEAVFAYLMGLSVSEMMEEKEEVARKLSGIIFGFLAPAFFFKAGLQMDLRNFTISTLILAITVIVIAYLSKSLGVFFSATKFWGIDEAKKISALFNFRLSFGVVAATIALEQALITSTLYSVIVMTIVATSIISSLYLRETPEEFYLRTPELE